MEQLTLNIDYGNAFDQACSLWQLRSAFVSVKRNRGAPGVDGVTVDDCAADLEGNLRILRTELWLGPTARLL